METKNHKTIAKKTFSAVILSAGFSSRMHDFKPLLPIGGVPALGRLVGAFYAAGLEEIIVVVGHRQEEVCEYLQTLPRDVRRVVRPVHNQIFAEGMYTSVRAGVRAVAEHKEAFFMLPVDYPLVGSGVFATLMTHWCEKKAEHTRLLYPVFGERRGHPPLLSAEFIPEILTEDQPMGLRSFFRSHQHQAENVMVNDETVLWDMDCREDYERLCAFFRDARRNDIG